MQNALEQAATEAAARRNGNPRSAVFNPIQCNVLLFGCPAKLDPAPNCVANAVRRHGSSAKPLNASPPKAFERPIVAIDRIAARRTNPLDPLDGVRAVTRVGAFIIVTVRRVGSHDKEVSARGDQPMAGACRQHDDIAGMEADDPTFDATELDPGGAAHDPHHLMNLRVIVQEIVHRIAP
jgi:hypothetical protein